MELIEAIRARHSVRQYDPERAIEPEKLSILLDDMEKCNRSGGLHIQLAVQEPKAFEGGLAKYGRFRGVRNYFIMAGPKGQAAEEKVGYYGERLVLLAQTLGLDTCWVGLTYKKVPGAFALERGEVVHCVISVGYAAVPGVQHAIKPLENFYEAEDPAPDWFLLGIEAAVLAPTAVNQQKFRFILKEGDRVEANTLFSVMGYTRIDLGIVKYHFEIGAGRENFKWV